MDRVTNVALSDVSAGHAEVRVTPDAPSALLRLAADSRRGYADQLRGHRGRFELWTRLVAEAALLEQAARVVDGDLLPLCGWLPVEQWNTGMFAAVGLAGPGPRPGAGLDAACDAGPATGPDSAATPTEPVPCATTGPDPGP